LITAFSVLLGGALMHAMEPNSAERKMAEGFGDLSIEELMNESVSSVSKRETKLSQSPAAIAVVTQDDIRRLGITSIPEALRWVPGLNVARSAAGQWAISARGFNSQFSNKLLVLMDGRTIYNPAFGGVFWDLQDTAMEDIERIEVIRGPGATLWGANAVNGVINIITKNAKDTQGGFVSGITGSEEQAGGTIRYGGRIGKEAYYRAYVKYFNRNNFMDSDGRETPDGWDGLRGGFRLDWQPTTRDALTLQGDYYSSHNGETTMVPAMAPPFSKSIDQRYRNTGGNVLGRWTHTFSETSELSIQGYYDHFRHGLQAVYETRDTLDFEFQHRFALGSRNTVTWGGGYRQTADEFTMAPQVSFNPPAREDQLFSAFVQDEIKLIPKRLTLILGSKFEHNDYTGFEVQPGGRLLWTPHEHHTVWASVSRAVRTPARTDSDVNFQGPVVSATPTPIGVRQNVQGNSGLHSEEVIAYELGYRTEPTRQLSLDLALFYNRYDSLIAFVPGLPELRGTWSAPYLEVPALAANASSAETYGAELAVQWRVTDKWRLAADYSLLQMHFHPTSDVEGESPQQQVRLRSYLQLPWNLEFNAAFAYVDELPTQSVPAYVRMDLGFVWHPTPSLEVGVWGQNLLDEGHVEFTNFSTTRRTEVPRSVQLKVTWKF
jgi:iron complex outermembrane recepter protein